METNLNGDTFDHNYLIKMPILERCGFSFFFLSTKQVQFIEHFGTHKKVHRLIKRKMARIVIILHLIACVLSEDFVYFNESNFASPVNIGDIIRYRQIVPVFSLKINYAFFVGQIANKT